LGDGEEEDITHVNEETDKNLRLINDVELNATKTHHHMTSSRERHVATWKCGQQESPLSNQLDNFASKSVFEQRGRVTERQLCELTIRHQCHDSQHGDEPYA